MEEYYHVVEEFKNNGIRGDYRFPIIWNVENIAKQKNANGFIVQHMTIISSLKSVPSVDYYEAWLVNNGSIASEDKGQSWDDILEVPYSYIDEDVANSFVEFHAKIYWIPKYFEEYVKVLNWERNQVIEAGGFRAIRKIDWDIDKFFVLTRNEISKR